MEPNRQGPDSGRLPKTARADRRWTLLFLGSRGKTVTFHHFKAVVVAAVFILTASTAVSAWFWSLYRNVRTENQGLHKEVENMKRAVDSVRDEKDILTARLVVAESRVAELSATAAPEKKAKAPEAARKQPAETQPAAPPVADKPEPPMSVDVQNFIVFFEPDINTLRVEYRLQNTGRKGNPVSGRTLVILKEDEYNPNDWLVLPAVPLIDDRPEGDRGMYFSINNFRTVRFKANDQIGPDQYKSATVFVFSSKGNLLLEKEFPVGLQSKTLSIVEPAAQRKEPPKPPAPAPEPQTAEPSPARPSTPADAAAAPPAAASGEQTPPSEPPKPPETQIRLP